MPARARYLNGRACVRSRPAQAKEGRLTESSPHRQKKTLHLGLRGEPAAMASAGFEEACREIRGARGHPRRLGLLLAPRSPGERQQIRAAYRASFGEDLAAALLAAGGQEDEVKARRGARARRLDRHGWRLDSSLFFCLK